MCWSGVKYQKRLETVQEDVVSLFVDDVGHQLLELFDADEEGAGVVSVQVGRPLPANAVTADVQVDGDSLLEAVTDPRSPLGQRVQSEAAETRLQSLGHRLEFNQSGQSLVRGSLKVAILQKKKSHEMLEQRTETSQKRVGSL